MRALISTGAYQDLPLQKALERISMLADSAEILSDDRHNILHPGNLEVLDSFNLNYTVHCQLKDLNIASVFPAERAASVDLHRRAIKVAAEAGASLYVVHPGYVSYSFYNFRAMRSLEQSLEELKAAEREFGVQVALENMPGSNWPFFSRPGLDLKGLGIVLDVGHANTCGSLMSFLRCTGIVHMHLHDNTGKRDSHLAIGKGSIDFAPIMKLIKARKITPVLEHNTEKAVIDSIKAIREYERGALPRAYPGAGPRLDLQGDHRCRAHHGLAAPISPTSI